MQALDIAEVWPSRDARTEEWTPCRYTIVRPNQKNKLRVPKTELDHDPDHYEGWQVTASRSGSIKFSGEIAEHTNTRERRSPPRVYFLVDGVAPDGYTDPDPSEYDLYAPP